MGMKFKVLVEYEYPTEHKLPVKAELVLHGDRVVTDNIKWIEQEPTIEEYEALKRKVHEIERSAREKIKALEQEPTTKNDKVDCKHTDCNNCVNHKYCDYEPTTKNNLGVDCIDRQATLDEIIKRLGIKNESYLLPSEKVLYQQIKDMPSVTPQAPRKGHWIVAKGSLMGRRNACCSNCKDFYTNDWEYMNYCPNCGADMREVEE